jgi:hypothetical protein
VLAFLKNLLIGSIMGPSFVKAILQMIKKSVYSLDASSMPMLKNPVFQG